MAKKRSGTKRGHETSTGSRSVKRRGQGSAEEPDDQASSSRTRGRKRIQRPGEDAARETGQVTRSVPAVPSWANPYQDSLDEAMNPVRLLGVFLIVGFAMIGSFGTWRRGLESFGVGHSVSFAVAVVADIFLMVVCLSNEAVWMELTRVRRDPPKGTGYGVLASLVLRIGLVYLYGWISLRGGGDWWDLF
jgi:hypothetical protein